MDVLNQNKPYQPQKHQISSSGRGCSFILGLIYIGVSLAVLTLAIIGIVRNTLQYNLLKREGVSATGVIIEKKHRENERPLRPNSHYYYVVYQYTALVNGSPANFVTEKETSSSYYFKYQVGQAIEILYAASDPKVSTIKAELGPQPLYSIPLFFIGVAFVAWLGYSGLKGILYALNAR